MTTWDTIPAVAIPVSPEETVRPYVYINEAAQVQKLFPGWFVNWDIKRREFAAVSHRYFHIGFISASSSGEMIRKIEMIIATMATWPL